MAKAIDALRSKGVVLSTGNAANFLKDIIRPDAASVHWPARLTALKITAEQRPGSERVFEFVPFASGQTEPFPNPYMPRPGLRQIPVQAVSLSLAKRRLGRKDESWLIQVAVELRLFETHFATVSSLPVEELSHLQTGVKLGTSEIDALFLAHVRTQNAGLSPYLITCEAKQEGQRISGEQVVRQVVATAKSVRTAGIEFGGVVPLAMKAAPGGRIYIAEFQPWSPAETELPEKQRPDLKLATEVVYALHPPVPGIGLKNVRPRAPRRPKTP